MRMPNTPNVVENATPPLMLKRTSLTKLFLTVRLFPARDVDAVGAVGAGVRVVQFRGPCCVWIVDVAAVPATAEAMPRTAVEPPVEMFVTVLRVTSMFDPAAPLA